MVHCPAISPKLPPSSVLKPSLRASPSMRFSYILGKTPSFVCHKRDLSAGDYKLMLKAMGAWKFCQRYHENSEDRMESMYCIDIILMITKIDLEPG